VTAAPTARAGSLAWNRGSTRTVPVKYSADALVDGCEPLNLISILSPLFGFEHYLYYLLQYWQTHLNPKWHYQIDIFRSRPKVRSLEALLWNYI
jgi:hypothetical protein